MLAQILLLVQDHRFHLFDVAQALRPDARPDAEQLVALRIHGVTPDYIQQLRSRCVQKLTLQQLVELRIHGIN